MPETVDQWAPMFLYYSGTSTAKFTREQVLDQNFAISTHGHCKLCDSRVEGKHKDHMRDHKRELDGWLKRRRNEAAKAKKGGLAAWRKEQAALKEIGPTEEDDE